MKVGYLSWSHVGLTDLLFAYRKAKVDCYFETSVRVAEKFVKYEKSLGDNLSALLQRLHNGEIAYVLEESVLEPAIFPKKVRVNSSPETNSAHAFFSDAKRAFKKESRRGLSPEFRMIGDFEVEMHIISALWVNLIGCKFDAQLGTSALASRLRRYRRDGAGNSVGDYHLEAIGSFEPYFEPYRRWRDNGLEAIKAQLEKDQGAVALTLDVSNFYHRIDPSFAVNKTFHSYLGIKLNEFEISFTQNIIDVLRYWSKLCSTKINKWGCKDGAYGGMPIGLSVVRVISNSIMIFLDREMERSVFPIYYARYVDDIFLVLRDNEEFETQDDIWEMLQLHIPALIRDEKSGAIELRLPEWGGSTRLLFKPDKQKCFFLTGASGLDLLENIASQIRDVSSERRLMPLPEQLDQTQSARALTATDSADEADNLRRADGLTLRRLGWSVLLRSIEVLARDLRPNDWADERARFYEFAHDHVIRPDKILEQIDRLPRLFALAVSLRDWKPALKIWRETISATYELQHSTDKSPMVINGHECRETPVEVWDETRTQIRRFFHEALFRSLAVEEGELDSRAFATLLKDLRVQKNDLFNLSLAARETDWGRVPYKEHLRLHATRHAPQRDGEEALYGRYEHEEALRRFLEKSAVSVGARPCSRVRDHLSELPYDSLVPFIFPTRAYTPEEIALYLPSECVEAEPVDAAHSWAEYTRAMRGIWVRSNLADEKSPTTDEKSPTTMAPSFQGSDLGGANDGKPPGGAGRESYEATAPRSFVIDGECGRTPIRVGITSFETSDRTWALGASGKPDLSPARYKAIAKIVNQALNEEKKPNYLIFPELSVPEQWIRTISSKLREGNISLIAGLDYRLYGDDKIDSSAVLVFDDKRLGYTTSIQIRQRKSQPAPGEEKSLLSSHGRYWNNPCTEMKPVYIHRGFYFSVLVCSELQNISYRQNLQGHVDCLFVLSWNKDLETFSALVDSASFDVHAYIALSNNLRYGDSRVRSPAREPFRRDVCRVRGGVNNQLVVVELDPESLRAQQSRAKRWPEKSDHYKPAPEGFRVSAGRRTTPS